MSRINRQKRAYKRNQALIDNPNKIELTDTKRYRLGKDINRDDVVKRLKKENEAIIRNIGPAALYED